MEVAKSSNALVQSKEGAGVGHAAMTMAVGIIMPLRQMIERDGHAEFSRTHRVTSGERRGLSKIGPKQIADAIKLWKRSVPVGKRKKLAARIKLRKQQAATLFSDSIKGKYALFYGTSEGAAKGWLVRRRKSNPEEVKGKIAAGTATKEDLHGLTVRHLLEVKRSLGLRHTGTKEALVNTIHGHLEGKKNGGQSQDQPGGVGEVEREPDRAGEVVREPVEELPRTSEVVPKDGGQDSKSADTHERAKAGDKDAIAEIVEKNQGLIGSVVKTYSRHNPAIAKDLMQEGNLGLLRALKTFDPSKAQFATYATQWIRSFVGKAAGKAAKAMKDRGTGGEEPKEEPEDTRTAHPSTGITTSEDEAKAHEMLNVLDDRSASILKMRYGIGGGEPMTLGQVAEKMGVSKQRVSELELKALKKLRRESAEFSELIDRLVAAVEFVELFGK